MEGGGCKGSLLVVTTKANKTKLEVKYSTRRTRTIDTTTVVC